MEIGFQFVKIEYFKNYQGFPLITIHVFDYITDYTKRIALQITKKVRPILSITDYRVDCNPDFLDYKAEFFHPKIYHKLQKFRSGLQKFRSGLQKFRVDYKNFEVDYKNFEVDYKNFEVDYKNFGPFFGPCNPPVICNVIGKRGVRVRRFCRLQITRFSVICNVIQSV